MQVLLKIVALFVLYSLWAVGKFDPALTRIGLLNLTSAQVNSDQDAEDIGLLHSSTISNLTPYELSEYFSSSSTLTELQRTNKEEEITGMVVEWDLAIADIQQGSAKNRFVVSTDPDVGGLFTEGDERIGARTELTAQSQEEIAYISLLKPNDEIRIRGVIDGARTNRILISPAIMLPNLSN